MRDLILAASLALAVPAAWADEPAPPPSATTAVLTQAEIMRLPDELRALLHERVVAPGGGTDARMQRLLKLTFDGDGGGMGLQYDFDYTRTVAETWRDRRANCLSFTLLFVAMAREAGLEAYVQEAGDVLTWFQNQGVIYGANHVNAGVRRPGWHQTVELDTNILATREQPSPIDDLRAMAHFHNNRGAELMAVGDLASAQALLQAALENDPGFVPAWNNLGVLRVRGDDLAGAEQAYLAALKLAPENSATLLNLATLYRRTGDAASAEYYVRRLDKVRGRDPFQQFVMAVRCEERGDYACAIQHYRTALRLQAGEHQFHFGLARAYFFSGNLARAQREMARARDLARDERARSVYLRKVEHIKRWQENSAGHAELNP